MPEPANNDPFDAHIAQTAGLEPMTAVHLLDDISRQRVARVGVP